MKTLTVMRDGDSFMHIDRDDNIVDGIVHGEPLLGFTAYQRKDGKYYNSPELDPEPKPECDHIVGCTEPQEDTPWVILLKKSQYKPRLYFLDPFKYCPECGEKLTTPNE